LENYGGIIEKVRPTDVSADTRINASPTNEWPLLFVPDLDALFVVRQWSGGQITAYTTSEYSDQLRRRA
jgi:hypothetical protein